MINREIFFSEVREAPFPGRLSNDQVDGMSRILDYWENEWALNDDPRHLAYMLATVFHETAFTMQPIREKDNKAGTYLKAKKYYPYFGRGLVQLTWDYNYKLMGRILSAQFNEEVDLLNNPALAQDWKYALPIMFEGMFRGNSSKGDFTGKSLEDYFNSKTDDPVNARRIINGTDDAEEIAGHYKDFLAAIKKATVKQPEVMVPVTEEHSSFRSVVDLIKSALDKLVEMYEAK